MSDDAPESNSRFETIADLIWLRQRPEFRKALEEFRIQYEAEHGETDLTRYWTSMWPEDKQRRLLTLDPRRYVENLPPFARAFLQLQLEHAAKQGLLDQWDESFIQYYLQTRPAR